MKRNCLHVMSMFFCIAFALSGCAKDHTAPQIIEAEFPFYLEYTLNGESYVYEDIIICTFNGLGYNHGHKSPNTVRTWSEKLSSTDEYYKDISGSAGEEAGGDSANTAEVIVAKNRHGSVGNVKMGWIGQFTKFRTLEDDYAAN